MSNKFNILDNGNGPFSVQKFGRNPDVDTAAAEDIWDGGGLYPFPAAAAATTIQSDNVADDTGGTGAITVTIEGLDSDFNFITETVTLNGTSAVALANQYVRVFRAYNVSVGSNGVNVGNITIQHGATVIAQISADNGQTLMAVYTVPNNYPPMSFLRWYGAIGKQTAAFGTLALIARRFGEGWRTQSIIDLNTQGTAAFSLDFPVRPIAQPKTDIIVRALSVSANATGISAGFDLKS